MVGWQSLSKLEEMVKDREAWHAEVMGPDAMILVFEC